MAPAERQGTPVFRSKLHPVRAELSLKDGELVARGEDVRDLVAVAHRQQPQRAEQVVMVK